MLPRRPLGVTLAVAALAVTAGGCTDSAPPEQARGGRADVTLNDFFIAPQRIRAKPGRITFRITNKGAIGHTLHVKQGARDVVAIKTLLPGDSTTASGTFKPGNYKLVCILGNHEVLGMYGTLTVR